MVYISATCLEMAFNLSATFKGKSGHSLLRCPLIFCVISLDKYSSRFFRVIGTLCLIISTIPIGIIETIFHMCRNVLMYIFLTKQERKNCLRHLNISCNSIYWSLEFLKFLLLNIFSYKLVCGDFFSQLINSWAVYRNTSLRSTKSSNTSYEKTPAAKAPKRKCSFLEKQPEEALEEQPEEIKSCKRHKPTNRSQDAPVTPLSNSYLTNTSMSIDEPYNRVKTPREEKNRRRGRTSTRGSPNRTRNGSLEIQREQNPRESSLNSMSLEESPHTRNSRGSSLNLRLPPLDLTGLEYR